MDVTGEIILGTDPARVGGKIKEYIELSPDEGIIARISPSGLDSVRHRRTLPHVSFPRIDLTATANLDNPPRPKWRNWQTRRIQNPVGPQGVRVRFPPSALPSIAAAASATYSTSPIPSRRIANSHHEAHREHEGFHW